MSAVPAPQNEAHEAHTAPGAHLRAIYLQPRAWTLQLRDLDELKPELLQLALVLALNADELGEVPVYLKSLAMQLGHDAAVREERRLRKQLERLRDLGLLLLVSGPKGRGYPSIWQLVAVSGSFCGSFSSLKPSEKRAFSGGRVAPFVAIGKGVHSADVEPKTIKDGAKGKGLWLIADDLVTSADESRANNPPTLRPWMFEAQWPPPSFVEADADEPMLCEHAALECSA
jgi:hypothetical protein